MSKVCFITLEMKNCGHIFFLLTVSLNILGGCLIDITSERLIKNFVFPLWDIFSPPRTQSVFSQVESCFLKLGKSFVFGRRFLFKSRNARMRGIEIKILC